VLSPLTDKSIVLGVCGGIAAYKSVDLLRLITKCGASVRVILTENAGHFVGPLTFEALSGQPVCQRLFEEGGNTSIKHIEWAQTADAVVIAPATANIIGKLACGIADDALSTFMLAVTSARLICPSMNSNMYCNDAVQYNLNLLKNRGYHIIEPGSGLMACGTTGPGRLPEPAEILDALIALTAEKDLCGKHVLVTAGPTREHVDPVRFISNPSSGKMGYAVARAAAARGAEVLLVSGPTALACPWGVRRIDVITASDMADAVFEHTDAMDIIVKVAAVADYTPAETSPHKIKKGQDAISVSMKRTVDILAELGRRKTRQILVGFAAETRDLETYAAAKLKQKNLDMIAGNLVIGPASGFCSDDNKIKLFYKNGGIEDLPMMDKDAVAHVIFDRIRDRVPCPAISSSKGTSFDA